MNQKKNKIILFLFDEIEWMKWLSWLAPSYIRCRSWIPGCWLCLLGPKPLHFISFNFIPINSFSLIKLIYCWEEKKDCWKRNKLHEFIVWWRRVNDCELGSKPITNHRAIQIQRIWWSGQLFFIHSLHSSNTKKR